MNVDIGIDWNTIDWETIDDMKEIGTFITLPDASQHYLQMPLILWYWHDFVNGQGIKSEFLI